jgi:prepilin-type N-terminal cleavage/methylation domain-containing protein
MKLFRHRKNSGFGLIEIMVTLGVLSVGILGVTSLHGVIARQSSDNKSRSEALSVRRQTLLDKVSSDLRDTLAHLG